MGDSAQTPESRGDSKPREEKALRKACGKLPYSIKMRHLKAPVL